MPVLIGPTYEENVWSRHPFWGRYKDVKGITLLVQGSTVTQVTYPWQGDLQNPDNPYDHVYTGGQTISISDAEAAVLVAAGYGEFVHPD